MRRLGLVPYGEALELQKALVEERRAGHVPDLLLVLQHPPVITLGVRRDSRSHVTATEGQLALHGIEVHETGRGGDVTYHGPGQLVVYPIVDLRSKLRKDVHRYVRNLEMTAIRTLEDFNLEGARRPPYTGIWIGDKKIAAIGVAVRRCITFHGLALNVNTTLSYFNRIVPCGLAWADVTSMQKELGAEQNLAKVRERFLLNFAEVFGYDDLKEYFEDRIGKLKDGSDDLNVLNYLNGLNG